MNKKNLIIGKRSQLSKYYQNYFADKKIEYVVVSARDSIEVEKHAKYTWQEVYLCFGESRKNLLDSQQYYDINYQLTKKYINLFTTMASSVYVYSTCELWNEYSGSITLSDPWKHSSDDYIKSKKMLAEYVLENVNTCSNVYIQYPFNFNSPLRTKDFLFGKIFHSILNESSVEIGNVDFYRDIIHPNFVIEKTINSEKHQLIGSGRMIYVFDFIKDLYTCLNLDFEKYVIISQKQNKEYKKINEYYMRSEHCLYTYEQLLRYTVKDLINFKNGNGVV